MIEQNQNHEELQNNYEALYERPIVDATVTGVEFFGNQDEAKTRLVLATEIAPGISYALEIDDAGLPRPNPFGRSAVQAVSFKDGQLNVGSPDYGGAGTMFTMNGRRAESGFRTGGASPSFGYYEEEKGTFTPASNTQARETLAKSVAMANELYEMTEGKPFEERALGPELHFEAAKQLARGIAERDYMDVNTRHSASRLARVAAEASEAALANVGGYDRHPTDLTTPFLEEVKDAVNDQDVWKNLTNGRIQHPDIYISEMNELRHIRGIGGFVDEVLAAAIKDDVKEMLESHKPDIDAVETKERADFDAQEAAYANTVQERKDAAAKEVIERFDGMLPEVVETPNSHRGGLKRKLAAAALAVTTALGLGTAAHEIYDTHQPTPVQAQPEKPALEKTEPSLQKPGSERSQARSIENKTDTVIIDDKNKSVRVELKEGGNPSFAVRDAYRAEGISEPSEQQIHDTITDLEVTDTEARTMQPGTTLSFTTQRAADGSIKLIAKTQR
jgi:hypothetical protein